MEQDFSETGDKVRSKNNLPKHVVPKPEWMNRIALTSVGLSATIYPYIYMDKGRYRDLLSGNPSVESTAVLIHEQVHWERQKELGILKFAFRYLCSRKFRYHEELLATLPQMKYLKKHGEGYDIPMRARLYSGHDYLWCVSYKQAVEDLEKLWEIA